MLQWLMFGWKRYNNRFFRSSITIPPNSCVKQVYLPLDFSLSLSVYQCHLRPARKKPQIQSNVSWLLHPLNVAYINLRSQGQVTTEDLSHVCNQMPM
jgi:hypothetical protein